LIELAFLFQDKKVTSLIENIKSGIISLRKSDDYAELNLFTKATKLMFPEFNNNFMLAIKQNFIRSYSDDKNSKKDNVLLYPDSLFTVKSSILGDNFRVLNAFRDIGIMSYDLTFTFNVKTYAVVDYTALYIDGNGKLIQRYHIKYHNIADRYYPYFIQDLHVNDLRKSGNNNSVGFSENLILFNDYAIDRNEFERIKSKNKIKPIVDVHDIDTEYDPQFWNNYNMIMEVPLKDKVKSDLSMIKELEEQFKENSTKSKKSKREARRLSRLKDRVIKQRKAIND
ncbi:MAG: hypothetical protein P1P88_17695, partial [Bacteroidales bacterium]|nr:hypothetical protein [Bacteroidales bacterium]